MSEDEGLLFCRLLFAQVMLAQLQRRIVWGLLSASILWCATFAILGHPWIGIGILPIIATCYALAIGLEFALLWSAQAGLPERQRASIFQLLGAWLTEVSIAPLVFGWWQPFRSQAEPDSLSTAAAGRRGVILVHGLFCNRGFWSRWLIRFRLMDVPAMAVNLEPVFGSIDAYAPTIETAVATMQAATGHPVVLVGHSMGGLAIRAWLRQTNGDSRIHRVVTIGTPHLGTQLARHAKTINGRQMQVDSPWLRQLAADEPPQRARLFSCCFSSCDNIVFPAALAALPGATALEIIGAPHVQLAFESAVFGETCRWLNDDIGPS